MDAVSLIGVGLLAGDQADLSGLVGLQTDGTPHNQLGGLGSAIDYSGRGNEYVLSSDRGPKDGATDYACRYHRMEIVVTPGAAEPVKVKLTATIMLKDESGRGLLGSLIAFDTERPERSLRFDPEGIRVGPGGKLFIADEYGPSVGEFSVEGKLLRRLALPRRFLPIRISAKPEEELPPGNPSGRQPNRGMEGLAISPNGSRLYGIMQSPLIQDGGLDAENRRVGVNNRILEIDRMSGRMREFVYPMEDAANGVNEILAVSAHTFLVLERDSLSGEAARFKKVFLIDLRGASDVSGVEALPSVGLPAGVKAVGKKLLLDMLDPEYRLRGKDFPEKIEGLAFGPNLADGRRLLIVTADNDFIATAAFRVYAFGVFGI
ncbi:MAG: esterase-like activity of phytase family protein [Burkholderiales bacterium]